MSNAKKLLIEPLRKTNPVTVLVLGICSCLGYLKENFNALKINELCI